MLLRVKAVAFKLLFLALIFLGCAEEDAVLVRRLGLDVVDTVAVDPGCGGVLELEERGRDVAGFALTPPPSPLPPGSYSSSWCSY